MRHQKIKNLKIYFKQNYEVFKGLADIYVYFFEKGISILKNKGLLGFICSNKFIKVTYGESLRKFITEKTTFIRYVNRTYDNVFSDATTYPSTFILKKESPNNDNNILVDDSFEMKQSKLNNLAWAFEREEILDLRDKIYRKGKKIKDITDLKFYIGILSGYNPAFFINKTKADQLISKDPKNVEIVRPLVQGKDIKRWNIEYKDYYVIVSAFKDINDLKSYPFVYEHLKSFEVELRNRGTFIRGDHPWWVLSNNPSKEYLNQFDNPKLIYPAISSHLFAVFDEEQFFSNDKSYIISSKTINLKFLSTLLSSKTLNFIFKFLGSPLQGNTYNLNKRYVEHLPICIDTPEKQQALIEKADVMIMLNKKLYNEITGFKHWITKTYNIEKLSQKLEEYYGISEDEFINELRKKKIDTKSRKNREYLEREFTESIKIIKPLFIEIEQIDKEIDQMVYDLYGLTSEEIKIIEDNLDS